jgi:hypothetical protein
MDLVLAMQMIFLPGGLPAGLNRMARFLRPGGESTLNIPRCS